MTPPCSGRLESKAIHIDLRSEIAMEHLMPADKTSTTHTHTQRETYTHTYTHTHTHTHHDQGAG